jgi:hypothetical protein
MEKDVIACELFANKAWVSVDIDTALKMPKRRLMRCPECHGRVKAHRVGADGQREHMEHYERHIGCSRGDCFNGVSSLHVKALS